MQAAIAAELVVRGDDTIECGADRSAVEFGENSIGGQAVSITGDEIGSPTPCNYRRNRPLAIAAPPKRAMSSRRFN